jgi:hypothetical protein
MGDEERNDADAEAGGGDAPAGEDATDAPVSEREDVPTPATLPSDSEREAEDPEESGDRGPEDDFDQRHEDEDGDAKSEGDD